MECIKSYFRCMFRALRDVHARGIIHRDIKPANFLFDPRTGIGTICDFGLACVRSTLPLCTKLLVFTRPLLSAWDLAPLSVHASTFPQARNTHTADYANSIQSRLNKSRRCSATPVCARAGHRTVSDTRTRTRARIQKPTAREREGSVPRRCCSSVASSLAVRMFALIGRVAGC